MSYPPVMPGYVVKLTSDESAVEMEVHAVGRDPEHAVELVKRALGSEINIRRVNLDTHPDGANLLPPDPEDEPALARVWRRMVSG